MSLPNLVQPFHLQIIFDSGLLILIWMVQLIIYPTFSAIAPASFSRWHRRYVFTISCLVLPLILGQALIELGRLADGSFDLLRLSLIGCAWAVTGIYSVPCHRRLQSHGKDAETIDRLIRSNWLRTLCWSALFAQTLLSLLPTNNLNP